MKGFDMNNKNKLFGIYLPVFALATLASVIMRTVACLIYFDYSTGYFKNNILINISDALAAAAALFLLSFIFTASKDMRFIPSFSSAATYVPTGITVGALLFFAVDLFRRLGIIFEGYGIEIGDLPYEFSLLLTPLNILILIGAIFAILSAVHFALTALVEAPTSAARANFGLTTVIFLAISAVIIYFDTSRPINVPGKVLDEITLLFAAVFFLYETRLSIGREKWREYIGFGFVAALLTAYSSIPNLIFYFVKSDFKLGESLVISDGIYLCALIFALFIFITARILMTGELIEDKKSPAVSSIIEIAAMREEALAPVPQKIEAEEDEPTEEQQSDVDTQNQITIEDITDTPDDIPSTEEGGTQEDNV